MKLLAAMLAISSAATFSIPAKAVVAILLPPPSSSVQCTSNNPSNVVNGTNTCSLQGAQAASSFNGPAVSVSVNDPASVATQNAFASLTYYFEVLGGNAGTLVPVLLRTSLTSSASYPNYASAELNINGVQKALVCTDGTCTNDTFNGTVGIIVPTLQAEMIQISAIAEEGYLSGGNVAAFADPYIYVDPTFADASRYSIVVSPGVSNDAPSAAPEPASWAMMILGFGIAGAILRRRERSEPNGTLTASVV